MAPIPDVWRHFRTLCAIPRASKQEAGIRDHLKAWSDGKNLSCRVDGAGNLIIRKPATAGYADTPGVILQGHLDMVCQKNQGHMHDFRVDPVCPVFKDGWLIAEHTTLGADNGIGVALALAVLESTHVIHGPLEVLLTVSEEDGMGGAAGLATGALNGKLMLNLDTEEWGTFYIGCAGAIRVNLTRSIQRVPLPADYTAWQITLGGLHGGHSGIDIDAGRGNAIKLLLRGLRKLERHVPLRLLRLDGGTASNAIPREAFADIAFAAEFLPRLEAVLGDYLPELRGELVDVDESVSLSWNKSSNDATRDGMLTASDHKDILWTLHCAPVGVRRMSVSVPGVVEISNNLGLVRLAENRLDASLLVRSLVDTAATALADEIACLFSLIGCQIDVSESYPSWKPNPGSSLLKLCREVYSREFAAEFGESSVQVIHAGLECGIVGSKHPGLDTVSFGPTIRGAHAPGERVELDSVTRCWKLLTGVLGEIAVRG